jgi:putative transposase
MPGEAYDSFNQAAIDIAAYIKYYNHERVHSYNGYRSPVIAEAI